MKGGGIGHFTWKIGMTSSQKYILTSSGSLLIKVMDILVVLEYV